MRCVTRIIGCLLALLLFGCARGGLIASDKNLAAAEFIGSTPGENQVREFLGGLVSNAPCHSVTWRVTLLTNQSTGLPATFNLAALYHVPTRNNPNLSGDGPRVALRGTWEIVKGAKDKPAAAVYRITAENSQRSLYFVKVGDNLLHLLNPDGTLAIGNGGWSYTLNRADHAEKPVEASLAMSAPDMSYPISSLATGSTVFAVFEGRSPCHEISRELKIPQHPGCMKVKWRVTLYKNRDTATPTTYKIEGTLHRQSAREGTWSIIRGAKTDPNATVYRLDATQAEAALFLLKGDDNVLFFLDRNRELLVGHAEFSYTLNRVTRK